MQTENGAVSLHTSGRACVDLFFKLTRDVSTNTHFLQWIDAAWTEDPLATMRILFHGRDCRGGKGDRKPFVRAMAHIALTHPDWFVANVEHVPAFGRYQDWVEILDALSTQSVTDDDDVMLKAFVARIAVLGLMAQQLRVDRAAMEAGEPASLLAKWVPSEHKKWARSGLVASLCRELFDDASPAARKRLRVDYLTPLRAYTRVVETFMSAGRWSEVQFAKVPGVAMMRLRKAFERHVPDAFRAWLADVRAGRSSINSSTVYPHELVAAYMAGASEDAVLEAQWEAIVSRTRSVGAFADAVCVCDVSGSMTGQPMSVAIALGLLIASVSEPPFRDSLITFAERPVFCTISSVARTLHAKVQEIMCMPAGFNTDFQAVFDTILERCSNEGPTPKTLYVLSDMQFDHAFNGRSNFATVQAKYDAVGRTPPNIVFWNLRADTTADFPVAFGQAGTALVSGFSPSILKQLLAAGELTPEALLRAVLADPRYACIAAPLVRW
jgi:hypothetical protein